MRFKHLGYTVLLLAGTSGYFAVRATPNSDAREAYDEAQAYLKQHDLRSARAALLNAVKADPQWTDALVAQAKVSLDLFDPVAAQTALERAIAAGLPQAKVQHLLGQALWMQGKLDDAEAVLEDEEIPPSNPAYAYRIMARVQMDKGDFAASQSAFDAAIKIAPKDSMIWTDLARLRFAAADLKGAIDAADYALKLDPNNVRALEFRGRLMRLQFGMVAALPWFERALQINDSDVPLLEEYALTLGEAGRYTDMLAQARRIISFDSNNPRAFYMQAVLAARAGNYELAKRILPRAGAAFNELPAAMLLEAICEYELGSYNRSVDLLQRLLAMQPRNRTVRTLLAQALYRAGHPLDALDTIREIAGRGDATSYALMTAARSFEASNQRGRAAAALDDAARPVLRPALPLPEPMSLAGAAEEVKRNPNNARAVIPYIRLLMAAGDVGTAYGQAIVLQAGNPGVADAHILVGDIEMARGKLALAAAAYQKAREINFTEPVMLRLVDALSRSGNDKAAGEALAAYLAFNPTSLTALRLGGYRNLDAKNWAVAITLLERVRARLGDNDAILLANIARAYSGAGQHDAATRNAAIAYRIAPANMMATHVYGQVLLKSGKRPKAAAELLQKAAIMMPDNRQVAAELKRARAAREKSAKRQ
jgi:tetratricopeptide (TPR) repeat protein